MHPQIAQITPIRSELFTEDISNDQRAAKPRGRARGPSEESLMNERRLIARPSRALPCRPRTRPALVVGSLRQHLRNLRNLRMNSLRNPVKSH
jgi:hypothetical protein